MPDEKEYPVVVLVNTSAEPITVTLPSLPAGQRVVIDYRTPVDSSAVVPSVYATDSATTESPPECPKTLYDHLKEEA